MGTEHDALLGLRVEHTHDVLSIHTLAVEEFRAEVLHNDRVGIFAQLGSEPFGAGGMGLGLRHTRAEVGLLGHKLIGRVGIEARHGDGLLGLWFAVGVNLRLFGACGK